MRSRSRAGVAAELRQLSTDRRLRWILALAVGCSAIGGLVHAAIAAQLPGIDAIELQTAVVSRGAATQLAVVLLMSVAVAGRYRDGSWLQLALAEPRPSRRLLTAAAPALSASVLLALVSAASATAAAALVSRIDPPSLALATCLHVAVTTIWALWTLCLAHASRSPMLTLAIGAGLPIVVEPAAAGLLTQADLAGLRWAMPGHALRVLAELPATGGALLQPVPPEALPAALGTVIVCTAVLAAIAWLRLRGSQPR
ncbi:hypothetical protein [Agrococcus sp. ARC_14]|uniref:hypothetical protein n=1 Tax=Agrococcus sp. ARC_14 TaxID=2919927 RepID=UPI001F062DC7|nr:hypothetical protein [Agrococcus sp. ARC_14]MCH1884199.1 hypothetical protein [Agrococcus sp. ARC_14]